MFMWSENENSDPVGIEVLIFTRLQKVLSKNDGVTVDVNNLTCGVVEETRGGSTTFQPKEEEEH